MKSIDKLRESSHLDDNKWTLETGEVVNVFGSEPSDPNAVNWGKQWRKIADEIEAEIADNYMRLPVDADGVPIRVGDEMFVYECEDDKPEIVKSVSQDRAWFGGKLGISGYNLLHVKPRTLENVLVDMLEAAIGYSDAHTDVSLVAVEKYADEIRELLDGE